MAISNEQRRQKRWKARVPATVRCGPTAVSAVTKDICAGGLFLYADAQFEPGSEIQIVLMLPKELGILSSQMVCCHARVVRLESGAEPGKFGIAARVERFAAMAQI